MDPRRYFPLGKAHGEAFCNRTEETKNLLENINVGKHTFLVAPRRYGKSSLCEKAFKLTKHPHVQLDFHLAVTEKDVEKIIINGVIELIGQAIGSVEKLSAVFKKYTKRLKPKLSVGTKHLHLELEIINHDRPAENIAEALLLLEKLLQKKNKQAVLLLDEFQEIGVLKEGRALEGAIRHVAQDTVALAFIFSGSCPHILRVMFEDDRRPLYKLCRKLVLDRINQSHYLGHLNKASKAAWKKPLPEEVFNQIITLTQRHPYYINYLCDIAWSNCKKLPTIKNINDAWFEVVEEERSDLLRDFFRLTENQRKILIHIASGKVENLFSSEALKEMDISSSSISRGINSLLEQDYIEKADNKYRLIVPLYTVLLKSDV